MKIADLIISYRTDPASAYGKLRYRNERYRMILAADAEYQRLHEAHKAAYDSVSRLQSTTMHYKIAVGTSNDMFFHVKAEGDSWEEVIDKLTAKKQAA